MAVTNWVGYENLTVTRTGSGVSWSFDAYAEDDLNMYTKAVCEEFESAEGREGVRTYVTVTGSASYGSQAYAAGSKTYTITQYSRGQYATPWFVRGTAECTVTWDTAMLRVVVNGTVTACANIKAKSGSTVKDVIGVYSVKNGVVKPGI